MTTLRSRLYNDLSRAAHNTSQVTKNQEPNWREILSLWNTKQGTTLFTDLVNVRNIYQPMLQAA